MDPLGRLKRAISGQPWAYRWIVRAALPFIRVDAQSGRIDDLYLDAGFLPLPRHFYYPVPDIADLEARDIWSRRSPLSGIGLDEQACLEFFVGLASEYGDACRWTHGDAASRVEFDTANESFSYGCAASTYMMLRRLRPGVVLEIGSGNSSRVIAQALEDNGEGHHVVVDPYPPSDVLAGLRGNTTVIQERVEVQPTSLFDQLGRDDVLFIDSSHVVRIGGDVNCEYLEVLPCLRGGVVVHVHDICLPYEYPKSYATGSFRYFWTEQYLLQAFLALNSDFEVLLPMFLIQRDYPEVFRGCLRHYNPQIHAMLSSSFWMKRVTETGAS